MNTDPAGVPAKKILVVDDNEIVIKTITLKLRGAGYEVITAMDGSEAVAMARKESPDLILLDVSMPLMDGYEVCRRLKARPETAPIPVLFLSANNSVEHRLAGFAAGAVDYICKPFSSEEVMARVYVHFKMPRDAQDSEFGPADDDLDMESQDTTRAGRIIHAAIALLHDPLYVWQGVEPLANKVGVIEKRLTALFRKQFGMTVSEYQINRRLEIARESLCNSDIQIQRIAETAGYQNASDFSRAFRLRYGMGPRAYRQAGTDRTRPS